MDSDPGTSLKWILDHLDGEGGWDPVAIAVFDFVDSTGRKSRSASESLQLQHILLHNLMAARADGESADARVKYTGDGCILCFRAVGETSLSEACLQAMGATSQFLGDIDKLNSIFRPSETDSWGVRTKCALHCGRVVFVNYPELYEKARWAEGFGDYFDSECIAKTVDRDPHGSVVDIACRLLNHCKKHQILASSEFLDQVQSEMTGGGQQAPTLECAGERCYVPAKGAAGCGKVEVVELHLPNQQPLGIEAKHEVTREQLQQIAVLKLADQSWNTLMLQHDSRGAVTGLWKKCEKAENGTIRRTERNMSDVDSAWTALNYVLLSNPLPDDLASDVPASLRDSSHTKSFGAFLSNLFEVGNEHKIDLSGANVGLEALKSRYDELEKAFNTVFANQADLEAIHRTFHDGDWKVGQYKDLFKALDEFLGELSLQNRLVREEAIDNPMKKILGFGI